MWNFVYYIKAYRTKGNQLYCIHRRTCAANTTWDKMKLPLRSVTPSCCNCMKTSPNGLAPVLALHDLSRKFIGCQFWPTVFSTSWCHHDDSCLHSRVLWFYLAAGKAIGSDFMHLWVLYGNCSLSELVIPVKVYRHYQLLNHLRLG
jgi:hypothetical protein